MKRLLSTLAAAALLSGSLGLPALSDEAAGAYLAARQARYESDYAAAAEYLTQALIKDPSNPELLDFTAAAFVSLGRIDKAIPVAHRVESITARAISTACCNGWPTAARSARWPMGCSPPGPISAKAT